MCDFGGSFGNFLEPFGNVLEPSRLFYWFFFGETGENGLYFVEKTKKCR